VQCGLKPVVLLDGWAQFPKTGPHLLPDAIDQISHWFSFAHATNAQHPRSRLRHLR
jgi:hypothetical protein